MECWRLLTEKTEANRGAALYLMDLDGWFSVQKLMCKTDYYQKVKVLDFAPFLLKKNHNYLHEVEEHTGIQCKGRHCLTLIYQSSFHSWSNSGL